MTELEEARTHTHKKKRTRGVGRTMRDQRREGNHNTGNTKRDQDQKKAWDEATHTKTHNREENEEREEESYMTTYALIKNY